MSGQPDIRFPDTGPDTDPDTPRHSDTTVVSTDTGPTLARHCPTLPDISDTPTHQGSNIDLGSRKALFGDARVGVSLHWSITGIVNMPFNINVPLNFYACKRALTVPVTRLQAR